jgi:hypothetical protein
MQADIFDIEVENKEQFTSSIALKDNLKYYKIRKKKTLYRHRQLQNIILTTECIVMN